MCILASRECIVFPFCLFVEFQGGEWRGHNIYIWIIGSSSEHLNLCSLCLTAIELPFPCLGGGYYRRCFLLIAQSPPTPTSPHSPHLRFTPSKSFSSHTTIWSFHFHFGNATFTQGIVAAVRKVGGRFLELDERSGIHVDIGDKKATEKTSQALREGQTKIRKKLYEDENEGSDVHRAAVAQHAATSDDAPSSCQTTLNKFQREISSDAYLGYSAQVLRPRPPPPRTTSGPASSPKTPSRCRPPRPPPRSSTPSP